MKIFQCVALLILSSEPEAKGQKLSGHFKIYQGGSGQQNQDGGNHAKAKIFKEV